MYEPTEIYSWAAYQFGRFEYRLAGYVDWAGGTKWIISEPMMTINPETGIVECSDGKTYKPLNPIHVTQKMEMMNHLGRWISVNIKTEPRDATEMINEELHKLEKKEDGEALERKEDEPLQAAPSENKKDKSSTRGRKRSKKEE